MINKHRLLLIGAMLTICSVGYQTAHADDHPPKIEKKECVFSHSDFTVPYVIKITPYEHFAVLESTWYPKYQEVSYPPAVNVPNYTIVTKRKCNYSACPRRTGNA